MDRGGTQLNCHSFYCLLKLSNAFLFSINTWHCRDKNFKYGKGDWRNISRKYVITRTPTKVYGHAQKYYSRHLSAGKEKMKPSIHDTPTVDHTDATAPSNNCNFHHIRSLL